ncbi:MAG: DMT family transporter [Alphaproteobacteria bacterium]|nr:DMT family transporter [Alphaproteobacteria bacterium]
MTTGDPADGFGRRGSPVMALAIASMIGGAFLFTASHGLVRHVGTTLHPFQIAFLSVLFSALFYVPWLMRDGAGLLRTAKIHLHILRAFFNAGAIVAWYSALPLIRLADATALALTGPLFTTFGAALFLGERMRVRRWVALGVGACGGLVIIRPGFETVSIGFLFVLASAISGAGSRIFAKNLTRWDSPLTCSAYIAILQMPITFVLALPVWQTPTLAELGWMAAVGVMVAGAQIALVGAYKHADVGAMEPLNFTRLVWAALIGFFVFREVPGLWSWLGAAIIVGASTYIARREARSHGRQWGQAPRQE